MKKLSRCLLIASFSFVLTQTSFAQEKSSPYLNVGYITNFQKCDECTQADRGGSIRLGILTKGKLGYYIGYLWFQEYHKPYIEYDDSGRALLGGINFRLLNKDDFRMYAQLGIEIEQFIATYPTREESETNVKPDFGLLFNFKFFNALLAWQPSEPQHINVGIGLTL